VQLPKISIITCSFQQAKFLERTILSVIDQNYPHLEYIVLDGGSTDGSVEIIRKYERHLAFWTTEKDGGQSAAINRGLKMATGDIVGWLNSDDTLAAKSLGRIGNFYATRPRAELLYGHTWQIDEHDRVLRRLVSVPTSASELIFFNRNIICQPGTTWRRRLHEQLGYLDESLHLLMDNDWWIRVAKVAKLHCVPWHLGNLRMHADTKTSTRNSERELRVLADRHGTEFQGGWRRNVFNLRRQFRVLREPRNWAYRLGLTG
jgi:glycosyltransferase involved in cell wall biosynthesis